MGTHDSASCEAALLWVSEDAPLHGGIGDSAVVVGCGRRICDHNAVMVFVGVLVVDGHCTSLHLPYQSYQYYYVVVVELDKMVMDIHVRDYAQ